MATYKNYAIKSSKGLFYESSKEKKDGFDTVFEKDGVTYNHREFTTVKGKLNKLDIEDTNYGKRLKMFVDEGEDVVGVLSIPIFNNYEGITDYTKALVPYLKNLNRGDDIEMWLNRKNKKANGYLYGNAYLKAGGEKVEWAFDPRTAPPKPVQTEEENKVTGEMKTVWNWDAHNKFYYDELMSALESFAPADNATESEKPSPKPEPATVGATVDTNAEDTKDEDYDDLPF